MKHVKKIACTFVLAALFCAMLAMAVSAADDGAIWLNTVQTEDTATVFIVTDTTVTDGLVEITYDAETMKIENVVPDEAYVAYYSVNSNEDGVIKIAWVAPEPYETNGEGVSPISVRFSTDGQAAATLTGTAYDEDGNEVSIRDALDTSELEKAILEAEALDEDKYTEDSYAALTEAVEAGEAVLNDPTATQTEVDAATAAIRSAIEALELKDTTGDGVDTGELEKAIDLAEGLDEDKYTEDSFADVEEALEEAKDVLENENATQEEVDAAAKKLNDAIAALVLAGSNKPNSGDSSNLARPVILAIVAILGIAAVCAVYFVSNKRRQAR